MNISPQLTSIREKLIADARLEYPVVLTNAAWQRLVLREHPVDPGEQGQRFAVVLNSAHAALFCSAIKSSYVYGIYHEDKSSDERTWVEIQLTVVTLPGQPPYLHISLLDESKNLTGEGL
ncbi:hypothetical protein K5D56_04475 [Pseudomonas cichorii]|nr:hypothetical protein [Pseudomonas cichorii]